MGSTMIRNNFTTASIFTTSLLCILAGCHDPRISVYDFIKLQEEYEQRTADKNIKTANAAISSRQQAKSNDAAQQRGHATMKSTAVKNTPTPYYDASKDTWVMNVQELSPQERYQPVGRIGANANSRERTRDSEGARVGGTSLGNRAGYGAQNPMMFPATPVPEFGEYQIGPSDVLRVSLTGLSGTETLAEATLVMARVNSDGEVNLPLIGAVKVAGMKIEAAERAIRAAYVPKYVASLAISVEIAQYASTDILIVGAAMNPGYVQVPQSRRNVAHAVAAAGGMTQEASGWVTLQRSREPNQKIRLFLRDAASLKSIMAMEPLESGDILTVETAIPNMIYIGGLVNFPGPRELPPGAAINILQGLAAAGGTIEALLPSEGTLVRRMPDGEDVQVKLDLERIKRGQDPNIMLAGGDIFWVPETLGTKTLDFLNRTIFLRAGATVSYNVTGVEFLNRRNLQGSRASQNSSTVQNQVDPIGFLAP